ncbi:response regulator transcription factor [Mucilaginibacter sp.]|uniref:response regulator n=1 Tax=Mucilaginibacter sp. TaxID=1882438 RepID=UPI00283C63E7|nr:response regulator transcription factor [Mucilaginibacter sp.]MDR3697773.1 response regulator transcription factor [Mucilaginibacter sp.]
MSELPVSVAIIDDDDLYRAIMVRVLQRSGMSVVFQANNGKSGIDQMGSCLPLPSVVIIDVEMPIMDGFETARRVKEKWPRIAIVAHSSIVELEANSRMVNSGADIFIAKSAGVEQLARTIKQIAASKRNKIS